MKPAGYSYTPDQVKNEAKIAGKVVGALVPIVGVLSAISGGASAPLKAADENVQKEADFTNEAINNNKGMTIQQAPQSAPSQGFGMAADIGDGFFSGLSRLTGGVGVQAPGNVSGGYAKQPTDVDSSAPQYSSKMQDYLNYMKYRSQ